MSLVSMLFFFFSSRRRHTRLQGDWSSDVCSSDLAALLRNDSRPRQLRRGPLGRRETMPKIPAERLIEIGQALFVAAGTPPEEAELVMRHIVGANLVGHDSHGVIQIPTYIERIKVGHIVPGAPWTIVQESPTTTVVDEIGR